MKEFFRIMGKYFAPYKGYMAATLGLNILTAFFNVFSFTLLLPILNILFKIDTTVYEYKPIDWSHIHKDDIVNNGYAWVQELITNYGAFITLVIMGLALIVMTALKTAGYFASSAVMVPLRTGVVRDIRNQLYQKITSLPLGFFSEERKGDIIARMSGDVQEVENSIMSSLDMLFKNPVLIIAYFATLIFISWQLTLFTLINS